MVEVKTPSLLDVSPESSTFSRSVPPPGCPAPITTRAAWIPSTLPPTFPTASAGDDRLPTLTVSEPSSPSTVVTPAIDRTATRSPPSPVFRSVVPACVLTIVNVSAADPSQMFRCSNPL